MVICKVGATFDYLARERGDYDVWFRAGLAAFGDTRIDVVRVNEGEPIPVLGAHTAIVVTGSGAMVTDRESWSVALGEYLSRAVAQGVSVLGVCYGHQLLADALGGRVDWNPHGRQVGTVTAELTSAAASDTLFRDTGSAWTVQTSHSQCVLELPSGAVRLARSPRDENHAYRVGERVWGVQFHPEFDAAATREYVAQRRDAIAAEGDDPDALFANVRDSNDGTRLLDRFARFAVAQG